MKVRNNPLILVGIILLIVLPLVSSLSVEGVTEGAITFIVNATYNSTDFWDDLDDPGDILGSDIVNDLGWITSAGTDSWSSNFTFYWNSTQINDILTGNNTDWSSTFNQTYHDYVDTWSLNYTDYWNSTQINDILTGNNTAWLSTYNATYHDNVNTDSWSGNYTDYWNSTQINDILTGNNTDWSSTFNQTYHDNVNTDSWSGNYTDYYNTTQIDNNFSLYWTSSIINSILSGNSTAWLSTFNQTYHDKVDTWSLNYTDYYNATRINELVSSNDTWRTNYSDYYDSSTINSLVSSNDTWRTNYSNYYDSSQ